MPGRIELLKTGMVMGWANHPVHANYPPVVHALIAGRVVASGITDTRRDITEHSFILRLPPTIDFATFQVKIGETDEFLALPKGAIATPRAVLTVEDLLGTPVSRRWVTGYCHIDARKAGLLPETILDLLCRDYLGRPAEPALIFEFMELLTRGMSYDDFRRRLVTSREYQMRHLNIDSAPGAIFSDPLVTLVASRDIQVLGSRSYRSIDLPSSVMAEVSNEGFIIACYRAILSIEPDVTTLSDQMRQLASGTPREEIIRQVAALSTP